MYDHAQSPRLGQRVTTDNTAVRMFSGQELPEAPWHGMMIYRKDTQELQVFDSEEDGWIDVVGGQVGQLTYVGDVVPVSTSVGDQWYNTATTPRQLYIAMMVGADQIATGEWEPAIDTTALDERLDVVEETSQTALILPTSFYTDAAPTGTAVRPLQEDDTWYDIGDGYKQYRYRNGQWTTFSVEVTDFSLTARKFITSTHLLY